MAVPPESIKSEAEIWSDAQVVEALRRGDEHVFAALVDRYHRSLIRLAKTYVHDESLAEEVAQEAWLGMLVGLPRFANRSSLRTWLFSILVNCARSRWRKESRDVAFSDLDADGSGDSPMLPEDRYHPAGHRWAGHWADPPRAWPEEHLLEAEVMSRVGEAIRDLPEHQQAVITLRDVEGWSSADVCVVLQISVANQRVLLHRARSTVRQHLETYFRQEADA